MTTELVTTLVPFFQFIGTVLDLPSRFYIIDVPADWIIYGCGFIGVTVEAYFEFIGGKKDE